MARSPTTPASAVPASAGCAVRLGQRLRGGGPAAGRAARAGDDLEEATRWIMKELDGFFTLVITTASGMSVVRDAFACKPAVVAETPGYVAVASEYRALAHLPDIGAAEYSNRDRRRSTRGRAELRRAQRAGGERASCGASRPAGRCAVDNPGGRHNLAVGAGRCGDRSPSRATPGTSSAACAGRADGTGPDIVVDGFVGWSVGENLMGGFDPGAGSASQSRRIECSRRDHHDRR